MKRTYSFCCADICELPWTPQMKVYARTNQNVLSWRNSVKGSYSFCLYSLIMSSLYFSFPLEIRPLLMPVRPQSAFCSNVFEISSSNKNKVDALLKGLASSDDPYICNIMIKQMNKSPLFTLLKYLWHWIPMNLLSSLLICIWYLSISTSCIRIFTHFPLAQGIPCVYLTA